MKKQISILHTKFIKQYKIVIDIYTKIFIVFVIFVLSITLLPINTYASTPVISIEGNTDNIHVGDEVSFEYKLDTKGEDILSVDLIFSYNPSILEFQDNNIGETGVQVNTSKSELGTITKKIVNPSVGEIQFSGSKIGGLNGEIILFQAIYKVLQDGNMTLGIDDLSKIYNADSSVQYDFTPLEISIQSTDSQNNTSENNETNAINLEISHISPKTAISNQDQYLEITITPQDKVNEARLYYKNSLDTKWNPTKMEKISDNKFQGLIPKEKMIIGSLQYFFGIMDINDKPHRDPVADDQFYTLEIRLDTTNTETVTETNTTTTNNIPTYNYSNTKNYSSTAQSGPGQIFIFILTGIIAALYAIYSESQKNHQN